MYDSKLFVKALLEFARETLEVFLAPSPSDTQLRTLDALFWIDNCIEMARTR
jgi:hypothetical protein